MYLSTIQPLLEYAVPVWQNIPHCIGTYIRKCAEKSHEYYFLLSRVEQIAPTHQEALAAASLTTIED